MEKIRRFGGKIKEAAIWSAKKALAFIMRCMPGKDDFSGTEQAKFRFRKTEYLQYKDAKGKKWFYDTLLLNDPNTRVETFEVKGNEYVCVITDQFPEDFTALLWKEKYQGIITDSKYGAHHINVYYNPKQKFEKNYPRKYFDKNVRYEHTIIHKDNPLILFLRDYIRDIKPEKDTTSIVLPVGKENSNKFKLPDGSTPYKDASAEDNIKLEGIIEETLVSITGCVNNKKLNILVPYVRDQIHKAGFDIQTAISLAYTFQGFNNTLKYYYLKLNADAKYWKQNEFPALDFNKMFPEQVPNDNITFTDIVEISNTSRTIILAERLSGSNSIVSKIFHHNGERTLANRYLDVLSHCLIEIYKEGIITETDTQLSDKETKAYIDNYLSETDIAESLDTGTPESLDTLNNNDPNSVTEYDNKGKSDITPYRLSGNRKINIVQAFNANNKFAFYEGRRQGMNEHAKQFNPVLQQNEYTITEYKQSNELLERENQELKQQLLKITKDTLARENEYKKELADAKYAGVAQAQQAALSAVAHFYEGKAEENKKKLYEAKLKREKSKAEFFNKIGKKLRKLEIAKKNVLPIKISDEEIANGALKILKEKYNTNIFNYFDQLVGVPTDEQIDSLADRIANIVSNIPEQTIHVEYDDLNSDATRAADKNTRATEENIKLTKELKETLNKFIEQSKSSPTPIPTPTAEPIDMEAVYRRLENIVNKPTPTPIPTPVPTPTPTPTPTPIPVPTPVPKQESIDMDKINSLFSNFETRFNARLDDFQQEFAHSSAQEQSEPPPSHKQMPSSLIRMPGNTKQEHGRQYTNLNPGYTFSHSSSNTSGEFSAPPPLKVYYPIKRNVYRRSI